MDRIRIAAAFALATGVAGCAVKPIDTSGNRITDDGITERRECEKTFEPAYCRAIELADGYRRGYLKRAGTTATLREATGLLAIPAAMGALYYGLSGREKFNDRILRLSTGAAGIYAAGQWSLKPAREQAYIEGAKAMTCAVLNSLQHVVPKALEGKSLQAALSSLETAIDDLRRVVITGGLSDAVREESIAALDQASIVRDELAYLHGETLRAGATLTARVQMIDAEVRTLVSQNSPTLDSLSALLSGLEGFAKTFGSDRVVAAPAAVPAGNAASEKERKNVVGRNDGHAKNLIVALKSAVADARVYLRYAESAQTRFDDVATCTPAAVRAFQILPDVGTVEIFAKESYSVTVTDRVGFPVVSLGGTQSAAVKLEPVQIGRADNQYVVVVNAEETAQKVTGPVLSIRAANGLQGRDIALTVVPAQPSITSPAPAAVAETQIAAHAARYPDEQTFLDKPEDIFAVQCLINADPDCRMGSKTREAIANYRALKGIPGGDRIDEPLLNAAKAVPFFNDRFACSTVPAKLDDRKATCTQSRPGS